LPNVRWLLALITAVHRFAYAASGGRLGSRILWMRFLLLTHTGRRSGRSHTVPLLFVEDEGRLVVAASNAGDARDPAWWKNLRAHPEAAVRVGTRTLAVKARAATAAECERLWPCLEAAWTDFARYRRRSVREIPLVVLEPAR
jgi:deazaflavin-dependent oxidoreductase (nitroreductase family)